MIRICQATDNINRWGSATETAEDCGVWDVREEDNQRADGTRRLKRETCADIPKLELKSKQ